MRTDVSVKISQGVEVVSSVVNAPSTSVVFLNSRRGGISEAKSSVHIYEPTIRLPIHDSAEKPPSRFLSLSIESTLTSDDIAFMVFP